MFFAKQKGDDRKKDLEKLAIFGPKRGRRGAELKVMSAIEHKTPGFILDGDEPRKDPNRNNDGDEDWGTDTRPLAKNDFSYALGKQGSTRKKLAWASGCIVQYVGHVAFQAGTKAERTRADEYLTWLIRQRTGLVHVETDGRDDVLVMNIPRSARARSASPTARRRETAAAPAPAPARADVTAAVLAPGPGDGHGRGRGWHRHRGLWGDAGGRGRQRRSGSTALGRTTRNTHRAGRAGHSAGLWFIKHCALGIPMDYLF